MVTESRGNRFMAQTNSLDEAQRIIGYRFEDPSLLEQALLHASTTDSRLASNERLEFLGDAVLGFLVCEYLHEVFPALLEGELTKIKSAVVSRKVCAKVAIELGLHHTLELGKGMQSTDNLPSSLAAAVFESVIGALYLDAGIDRTREFVISHLEHYVTAAATSGHQSNFKSVLQQHAQATLGTAPGYVLLDEQGPDHAKCFQVCVQIGKDRYPGCWAASKKQAEQLAALSALEEMGLIHRDERGLAVFVTPDTAAFDPTKSVAQATLDARPDTDDNAIEGAA